MLCWQGPRQSRAAWQRLASAGLLTDCVVLACRVQYPTTWLHELGHNLYMNHAGSYQDNGGGSMQVCERDTRRCGACLRSRILALNLQQLQPPAVMTCLPSQ